MRVLLVRSLLFKVITLHAEAANGALDNWGNSDEMGNVHNGCGKSVCLCMVQPP